MKKEAEVPEKSLFRCECGSRDVWLEAGNRNVLMHCETCLETYSFGVFEFIQLMLEEAGVSEFTLGAQIKVKDFNSAVLDVEEMPDTEGGPVKKSWETKGQTVNYSLSNPEAIARRGEELYQEKYREEYELKHHGEFLVIQVTTGRVYLAQTSDEAFQKAWRESPQGLFHLIWIGHQGAFHA